MTYGIDHLQVFECFARKIFVLAWNVDNNEKRMFDLGWGG